MPIMVVWDDEAHTILRLDFMLPWTWEEFDSALDKAVAELEATDHPVFAISNLPLRSTLPYGRPFQHFLRAIDLLPANIVLIIVVTANPFVRLVNTTFLRLFPTFEQRTRFADSLDKARQIIAQYY